MVTVVSTIPHPSVVKEVVCKHCGSTLNYVPIDVKEDYTSDYTGDKDYYKYIGCPTCNNIVVVKS
jgi:DNA-directed RNA polymerase subunit RPC12/RpoP